MRVRVPVAHAPSHVLDLLLSSAVDQMLQNMDKTSTLETSTQELSQQANAFRSTARRTRKKMCWQNAKMYLALGGGCLVFILVIGFASGWFGGGES